MTGEIKVDVPGAPGAYGTLGNDVAANRTNGVGAPAAGLPPGVSGALGLKESAVGVTDTKTASQAGQGSQFANGFGEADRAGAAKAEAAGPKGPVDPSSAANAPKVGADKFASRLTPNDLLKLASSPYQSAMPLVQSVPSAAQSIPSLLNAPLQAAQAPIQAMLAGPGGAPMLDQILARGNASNGFDGGPASQPLGSRPSGPVEARLYDVTKRLLGMPYAWGGGHGAAPGPSQGISDGGGPADRAGDYRKVGLDCSGLSRYVLSQVYGVDIGGTSQSQYASGMPVSSPTAGDLVFPKGSFGSGGPGHVQVYLGNGQVLEAPSSGQTVKISPLSAGAHFRRFVSEA
ncbi:C40 family peptidase [Mycolicibacterium mageritense]|uniref:C40 family peptidase n=1 Tax=Mycolicibacterium mageritense TaxID=53462 RepID=UPI0011D4ED05|nr:C40 family peptidase [Mycolicibacterium mageritense]TXI64291.1 MAG: peptidoglycan endopeptidase [Mycolicibacterium mageritense]